MGGLLLNKIWNRYRYRYHEYQKTINYRYENISDYLSVLFASLELSLASSGRAGLVAGLFS